MTRDERRTFVANSGLFDGDTTDLGRAVGEYFTRDGFNAMFGADWVQIQDDLGHRCPASEADWAAIRAEAVGMIAERCAQ